MQFGHRSALTKVRTQIVSVNTKNSSFETLNPITKLETNFIKLKMKANRNMNQVMYEPIYGIIKIINQF